MNTAVRWGEKLQRWVVEDGPKVRKNWRISQQWKLTETCLRWKPERYIFSKCVLKSDNIQTTLKGEKKRKKKELTVLHGLIIKLMQNQRRITDQKTKKNHMEDKNVTARLASGLSSTFHLHSFDKWNLSKERRWKSWYLTRTGNLFFRIVEMPYCLCLL